MSEEGILTGTYFGEGIKCQTVPTSHVRKINSRSGINIYATSHYHLTLCDFLRCCKSRDYNYTYTCICGNIINNNDERTHFFRKIYLSTLYSKGLRKGCETGCVWEVSWRRNRLQTYWPQVPLSLAALLFSFCWAASTGGPEGPKPSAGSWFSLPRTATRTPTNWLKLTQAVCGTRLYNCLTLNLLLVGTAIAPNSTPSRWYPDIFDQMHLFLDWRLGRRSKCYSVSWKSSTGVWVIFVSSGVQGSSRDSNRS